MFLHLVIYFQLPTINVCMSLYLLYFLIAPRQQSTNQDAPLQLTTGTLPRTMHPK